MLGDRGISLWPCFIYVLKFPVPKRNEADKTTKSSLTTKAGTVVTDLLPQKRMHLFSMTTIIHKFWLVIWLLVICPLKNGYLSFEECFHFEMFY